MQIQFTGRHIEVTAALRSYTEEKMQRLLQRDSQINQLDVTFHLENVTHIAEATVHTPNGGKIHASAESNDMYAAIDLVADKLLAQITRHKDKQSDHR